MATFVAALVVFLVAMSVMAVGVVFRGRSLKGSCGGVGGEGVCSCDVLTARACPVRRITRR